MDNVQNNTPLNEKALAEKVDWTPMQPGGSNFKTYKLKLPSPTNLIIVHRHVLAKIFSFNAIIMTIIMVFLAYKMDFQPLFIVLAILMSLGAIGIAGYYKNQSQKSQYDVSFNKADGTFWRGHKDPRERTKRTANDYLKIDNIKALQLIREAQYDTDNQQYYSYELNLVFSDASRMTILDSGNKKAVLRDAEHIAQFLDVPLWQNF